MSNKSGKVNDHGAMMGISDFSNVSGTQSSLIPKYEALDATKSPSKTSTPDLIESEIGNMSTGVKCDQSSGHG